MLVYFTLGCFSTHSALCCCSTMQFRTHYAFTHLHTSKVWQDGIGFGDNKQKSRMCLRVETGQRVSHGEGFDDHHALNHSSNTNSHQFTLLNEAPSLLVGVPNHPISNVSTACLAGKGKASSSPSDGFGEFRFWHFHFNKQFALTGRFGINGEFIFSGQSGSPHPTQPCGD